MKELGQYLGATYSNICQPEITTKKPDTSHKQCIPNIMTDNGAKHPKNDAKMTHIEKKNTNEAIHQKLRNKYEYETNMHKIYNIIVVQTHHQLQEKAASYATLQMVKTSQKSIGYLKILDNLCFHNQL